jgi:hypothetical protein
VKLSFVFLFLFLFFQAQTLWAHPVSFKSSKGVMGYHSSNISHNQLNYSVSHRLAFGAHHIRRPEVKGAHASFLSANFLLKRWNGKGLQANIYSILGVGESRLSDEARSSGLGLLQFDIENREYYFLAKYLQILNEEAVDLSQSVVRFGVAPYVADYEDIHSWLILEWQTLNFNERGTVHDVTPFLRVFYRNLLFEVGYSFDGRSKFNYISHF